VSEFFIDDYMRLLSGHCTTLIKDPSLRSPEGLTAQGLCTLPSRSGIRSATPVPVSALRRWNSAEVWSGYCPAFVKDPPLRSQVLPLNGCAPSLTVGFLF